ncbi:xanthine dehydrogenase family protein subunit M [Luteolibacter sp. GHJ8]|uniref:Xanthine dehydrogenase family protein subunit M n=1 Tax=Luteolibacter rhizosphaerae TaxID=2989719 RepID=A0ABT3GB93_9BACT|nr:xanthine dehydrogenase family protein subunit M [Luteolibacter rhizosphaerae]MCW1916505.1 xanthine dehydrogenase family protein subunit M [Luteolibacter rhizosphaerae]
MNPFTYSRVATLPECQRELGKTGSAAVIAGGTNLLDLMKEGIEKPSSVVDINPLPWHEIAALENGGLRLGALARNAETAAHPAVAERYPLLAAAILAGASPQIRNMASNGGNLMQRTRCFYFYDTATPCNKRSPGSGCAALKGFNRIHAVLGGSASCIAVHPSDMCVALAALEAVVIVEGARGSRAIPFANFHLLPGDTPDIENTLAPDEMIVCIDLPPKGFANHYSYVKVRDRRSYAFALVSVAAALEIEDGAISTARLALGGVAHKPWRDERAERVLTGRAPARENFQKAADVLMQDARGRGFNDFKIELARRAIVRALEEASNKQASES